MVGQVKVPDPAGIWLLQLKEAQEGLMKVETQKRQQKRRENKERKPGKD